MSDSAEHTMPAGTAVLIGEPAIEPVELLAAIVQATEGLPAVRSLSRCWAQSGQQPPGLVIGVDLQPDDREVRAEVAAAISAAVTGAHPDFVVDVVFAADGGTFTRWMQENVKPFEKRTPPWHPSSSSM
jgi:hypothetical protein